MPALTISAAARLCYMDRRTLQRAIHAGRLHLDAQHCLSTDELMLAGYLLEDAPQAPPRDTPQSLPQETPQVAPQGTPLLPLLERLTLAVEGLWQEVRELRAALRQPPQGPPQAAPAAARPTRAPLSQTTPQETPQVAPQRRSTYDPAAAVARMRELRQQGLTHAQIAAHLTAEGIPTKYGLPWQKSSVMYMLKAYG